MNSKTLGTLIRPALSGCHGEIVGHVLNRIMRRRSQRPLLQAAATGIVLQQHTQHRLYICGTSILAVITPLTPFLQIVHLGRMQAAVDIIIRTGNKRIEYPQTHQAGVKHHISQREITHFIPAFCA
ncbi:MAG: hypothetical protein U1F63_01745 [Chitinivorax sp.]